MQCYKNAQKVDSVDILDRAFHYGDGFFSTAKISKDVFELKDLHFARLKLSAERLSLDFELSLIDQTLLNLKKDFGTLNGTLKILISRGIGQRGYAIPDHPADIYIFFYPKSYAAAEIDFIQSGVLETQIGLMSPNLVGIKSLNRLEQVILKQESQSKAWIEALTTDVTYKVVEGVSSNCFIRINGRWITPELRYNGVHGVMRAEILSRMQRKGILCEIREVDCNEISQFESLFFCNALSPMKAVTQLGDLSLDVQPCVQLFQTLQLSQMHEYV